MDCNHGGGGRQNYGQAHKWKSMLYWEICVLYIWYLLFYIPPWPDGHLLQKHIMYLQRQSHDKLSLSRGAISIPKMRKRRLFCGSNNQSQTTNHSCVHTTKKEIQQAKCTQPFTQGLSTGIHHMLPSLLCIFPNYSLIVPIFTAAYLDPPCFNISVT